MIRSIAGRSDHDLMNLRLFCRYVCMLAVVAFAGIAAYRMSTGGNEDAAPCGGADDDIKYLACGEFYYWFPGMEMTSGRSDWGGADPMALFKEEIWDCRGRDFNDCVWNRMVDEHHWIRKLHKSMFDEAIGTVRFGHSRTAITWGNMCAMSKDRYFAADLVNSCMDELCCVEQRVVQDRKNKIIDGYEKLQFSWWKNIQKFKRMLKTERRHDKVQSYSNDLSVAETIITNLEAQIETIRSKGVEYQLHYKVMRKAEPPKEPVTLRELKSLERAWK